MDAIIELVYQRGYHAVTTIDIAKEAGVSEKTLFRHFPSKLALLEAACDQIYYASEFRVMMTQALVYELTEDLTTIFTKYHEIANKNRKILIIGLREEELLPDLRHRLQEHPKSLLRDLEAYLEKMIALGKVRPIDTKTTAMLLATAQYGAFVNRLEEKKNFPEVDLQNYIRVSVNTFVQGLRN